MYNRYIPETIPRPGPAMHTGRTGEGRNAHNAHNTRRTSNSGRRPAPPPPGGNPLDGLSGLLKKLDLSSLLQSFGLGNLDTGDILLLAILLLLFLEGDNWELVIILGLLVLFGLGDDDDEDDCEL